MQLWQTLASQQKARELATTAAERVYRSDAMKKALEGVATGIGKEIGKRIELATVDTAGPATQCVQAFLGPRYGATIARIVATGTGREYGVDPVKGTAQVSTGQVIVEGTDALAGTVVLLVRRQLANMASRIGQRVVGSILGRLVSMVAGGVGLVLIAKDIWDFRHGVLPIIGTEMKSKETKDKVREELAKSVSEQIGESIKDISDKTADRVVEIWLEFRRAHAKVVELADRRGGLQALPGHREARRPAQARRGRGAGAGQRRRGRHHPAPRQRHAAPRRQRPADGRHRDRPRDAIAGGGAAVVGRGRRQPRPRWSSSRSIGSAKPDTFTKASLQRCWALQDRVAVIRLAALQPAARDALFELPANELKGLARTLDETQLDSLSRYLTGLDKSSALRVLQVVGQNPTRMAELGKPSVRDAILSSSDQAAALGMMLQATSVPDPTVLLAHAQLVLDGRVSPMLLWEKHAVWLAAAVVLSLALLMMLKRLVFGTRPKIVVQEELRPRAREPRLMRLVTSENLGDEPIERGELVYACAVSGANILRDMREAITNTLGGNMTRYEALLDKTIARALESLSERARAQGYDGVLGIRISHPHITDGAIEVVVAGTGFRLADSSADRRAGLSRLPTQVHRPRWHGWLRLL